MQFVAIIPRRDATSEELKALGSALFAMQKQSFAGALVGVQPEGLDDLFGGELPTPNAIRIANWAQDKLASCERNDRKDAVLAIAATDWKSVPRTQHGRIVVAVLDDGAPFDHDPSTGYLNDLIDGIRESIPQDLVEGVMIYWAKATTDDAPGLKWISWSN